MVHQRDERKRKKSVTLMIMPHNTASGALKINLPLWGALTLGIILVTLTRRINGDVPNISTMHLHIFAKKLLAGLGNPTVSIPIRCCSF